jgi:signal transduction histidine kinase
MDQRVENAPRNVIVVDDDPILRELMSEQLSSLGWRVTTAEDGEAAIGCINRDVPDLAIVDLSMPKLDGFGLIRYLHQNPRTLDVPVMVCTSLNERDAIDEAYRLGAAHFVTKPVNWPQFLHHVQFVMRSADTERELRAAKAEAQAASRMKSAMFQVLSHELKTPLTALIGMTNVVERSLKDRVSPDEAEQLAFIVEGARRLNGMVSDVLILSKAVGGSGQKDFEPVKLSEILDDSAVGFRQRAASRRIKLLQRPLARDAMITCDVNLIRQALAKLIDNAIKFSPDCSTVEIWGHLKPGGQVIISVKDQGPGISQQKVKECLLPFVQENMSYARPAEGMGLGLPIARTICEAHGGELLVQSSPGQGMLAAIILPASLVSAMPPEEGLAHAS